MAHDSTPLDWKLFSLLRAAYLQGPPLWDVEDWVRCRARRFATSPRSRLPGSSAQFRDRTLKEAAKERKRRWRDDKGHYTLHLLSAVDIMQGVVEDLVEREGFPHKWDPAMTQKLVLGGLHCADTVLTPREKEAFHLEALIGVDRAEAALAMNIGVKGTGAALSNAWKALKDHTVDLQAMRWFVESGTEGTFSVRNITSIEEEMEEEAKAAQEAAKVREEEESAAAEKAAEENDPKSRGVPRAARKGDRYEEV